MPQPYENGSRFMRKPAMDGKFPTAVLLRPNLARGRPFSRLSFAAMRLFDENLFQITGRRCFCPPSTQSAGRRAVSISKEKRASPCPAFRKPPEPARRQNAAPAKATPSPPAYPIRSLPLFAFSLFTPHIPTFAARKSKPHIIDCGRTVPKIGVRQSGSRLTRGRSYPASSRNTGI